MSKKNNVNFCGLGLNLWLIRQCEAIGVTVPTEIQKNCIPKILNGFDCIGCAKTGSGKTLAFALPILQKFCEEPYGIFALIITPTRELAYQIGDQFSILGNTINLRSCVITGGMDMIIQAQNLAKKPHVVIATPGRLADHIESCDTFTFKNIKFLVLDEADRLLGNRFNDQLKVIFGTLPKQKQILLFSATMTDSIDKVKSITSKEVYIWKCEEEFATVGRLNQYYVLCPNHARDGYLVETIRTFMSENENSSIIIFTNTCKNCQLLSMTLNEVGFENAALHSFITQKQRLVSLAKFKSGFIKILIATDVASRGLDIPVVSLVVNHIIPNNSKDYIHRVGRTARAGRSGNAISLISPYEISLIHAVENAIGIKMKEYKISGKEVAKFLTQVKVTMREAEFKLDETDFDERKLINKKKKLILQGKDVEFIEKKLKKLQNKQKKKS
ncbi:hypothetical protein PGB90_005333 [Kerria lacca]